MRETQVYTGEKPLTNLILEAYVNPTGTASTSYYEDDGHSTAYQQGAYNQTAYTVRRTADGGYTLTVRPEHTGFDSEMTSQTVRIHNVTDAPAPPAAAARARKVRVRYRAAQDVLEVRVPKGVRRVHVRLRR